MKIKYKYITGESEEVEVSAELGEFITASRREEENAERRHRYHSELSLDGLQFDSGEFITDISAESAFFRLERNRRLNAALDTLTPTQRRRLELYASGMTYREIAGMEGVGFSKVEKSIEQARKKIKKSIGRSQPTVG